MIYWILFIISAFLTVYLIGLWRGWLKPQSPYYKLYKRLFPEMKKEWEMPKIKDGVLTKYGWVVRHPENLYLGENTDIGFGTYIQAKNGVNIGKNVQIGSHCSIYSENTIEKISCRISIEPNVCIGAGTVIIPRKKYLHLVIGENSIIGALSLIRDSIPDNSIYAGIPAKQIKESDLYDK